MQERVAVLERHATASVESLHHIRARTSRVLAATTAFSALRLEAISLSHVVLTLGTLARVHDESVDRDYIERKLRQLHEDMHELRVKFARELVSAAESERPPPPSPPTRPW